MKTEDDLSRLKGIGQNSVKYFEEEGFSSIPDLEDADFEDVMEVKYMQEDRAEDILESVEKELENMRNTSLFYNPAEAEYAEEEPENYKCNCKASFPQKAVFLAHANICDEV